MGTTKYWNEVRQIVEEESVTFAEARTLWRQRKKNKQQSKSSPDSCKITEDQEAIALSCPYCREMLIAGDFVYQCCGCSTVYHEECIEEFGKCATLGCEGKGRKKEIEIKENNTKIVVTVAPDNQPQSQRERDAERERSAERWRERFSESFVENPRAKRYQGYFRILIGLSLIIGAIYLLATYGSLKIESLFK